MNHIVDSNPLLEEMRKAYHNSVMYAKLNGNANVEGTAAAALPLGIARDPLEEEFGDRMNP